MSDERDWRRRRSLHGDRASNPGQPNDGEHPTERLTGATTPYGSDDTTRLESASTPGGGLPFDMTDVHIDDQFIDALSQGRPVPTRDEAEYALAEMLTGWRHEVLSEAPPALPTIDEVETAIAAAEKAQRPRGITRHLRVASGVAAVVVVAVAGLTVLSQGSQPGDPLWGVKSVVFASAASETQASVNVQSNLEKAEAAIAAGDTTEAQSLVAQAEKDLGPVRDSDTRDRMNQWITRLRADVTTTASKSATTAKTSQNTVTTSEETGQQPDRSRERTRREQLNPGESATKSSKPSESSSPVPPPPPPSQGEQSSVPPAPPVTTTPTPTSATLPRDYPGAGVAPAPSGFTTSTTVWPN